MKRILKYIAILLIGLLIALVLLPFVFESKIKERVKTEIEKQIEADVEFSDISLSFFKSFPFPSVAIQDLIIDGEGAFKGTRLAEISELFFEVNLRSVINKSVPVEITEINIIEPNISIKSTVDGVVNYDILKESSAESSSTNQEAVQFNINSYVIKNGTLSYEDQKTNSLVRLSDFNHSGKGNFSDLIFELQTETDIADIDYYENNLPVLKDVHLQTKMPVTVNLNNNSYEFTNASIFLNQLQLSTTGQVIQKNEDEIDVDLVLHSTDTKIKDLLSILPHSVSADFDKMKAEGSFVFKSKIDGVYNTKTSSLPTYDISLVVQDGRVQYPELALPIEDINVDLNIKGLGNAEKSDIKIEPLTFTIDGEKVFTKLIAQNSIATPTFDFALQSKVQLQKIKKAMPLKDISVLEGNVDIDILAKGLQQALVQKKYDQLVSEGDFTLDNFKYKSKDLGEINIHGLAGNYKNDELILKNKKVQFDENDLTFDGSLSGLLSFILNDTPLSGTINASSKSMNVNPYLASQSDSIASTTAFVSSFDLVDIDVNYSAEQFIYDIYNMDQLSLNGGFKKDAFIVSNGQASIGNSDFTLGGRLDGLYDYLYHQDILNGTLDITSEALHYADFVEETEQNEEITQVPLIPDNVDINVQVKAKTLTYNAIEIKNVSSQLFVEPNQLKIIDFKGSTFGGDIVADGFYGTSDPTSPSFGIKYQLENLKIAEAIAGNKTFKILLPVAKYVEGLFNSTMVMEGNLKESLLPDLNTLTGSGFFETLEGKVNGLEPLQKINSYLNFDKAKEWSLRNSKNWFEVKDGALSVKEFDINVGEFIFKVSGSHNLNQNVNYLLQTSIPREYIERNQAGKILSENFNDLIDKMNNKGLNIDAGKYVDVDIEVTGNITSPEVNIRPIRISEVPVTDQVKDQIKEKIVEVKTEVEDSIRTVVDQTVTTIKDTINTKTEEIKDTIAEIVTEVLEEQTENIKDIVIGKTDSLLKDKIPDTLATKVQENVEKIIKENTNVNIDSIKGKIKDWNPFKKKKKTGN